MYDQFYLDGAGLFYISEKFPDTVAHLKSYILHRIFTGTPVSATAQTKLAKLQGAEYQFTEPANFVQRDRILIPSGWDTVEKIRLLNQNVNIQAFLLPSELAFPTDACSKMVIEYRQVIRAMSAGTGRVIPLVIPQADQEFLAYLSKNKSDVASPSKASIDVVISTEFKVPAEELRKASFPKSKAGVDPLADVTAKLARLKV